MLAHTLNNRSSNWLHPHPTSKYRTNFDVVALSFLQKQLRDQNLYISDLADINIDPNLMW